MVQLNGIFCQESVTYDLFLIGYVAYNIINFSPFVVHTPRWCLDLNEEHTLGWQFEFDP